MRFITRAEARLRPPSSTPLSIVNTGTTGHWEGPSLWGGTIGDHARCPTMWRAFQAYHMDHNGWSDIAYNAGACPHGFVLEGRGPARRSAANGTNGANSISAVVCYLGGVGDPFTDDGKRAMRDAADYLRAALRWGHRDHFQTACPGDAIYHWIHAGAPLPGPDPTPTPPPTVPPPQPEDETLNIHRVRVDGDPTVYAANLATVAHPIHSHFAADVIAGSEGHKWADPPVGFGAKTEQNVDGDGQVRTVWIIDPDDARTFGIGI